MQIDLTPEGVRKDPERVERAIRAKDDAGWALLNLMTQFFDEHGSSLRHVAATRPWTSNLSGDLRDIAEATKALDDAQEEFFRAVAGR